MSYSFHFLGSFAWGFSKDYRKILTESKAFLDPLVAKHWG